MPKREKTTAQNEITKLFIGDKLVQAYQERVNKEYSVPFPDGTRVKLRVADDADSYDHMAKLIDDGIDPVRAQLSLLRTVDGDIIWKDNIPPTTLPRVLEIRLFSILTDALGLWKPLTEESAKN